MDTQNFPKCLINLQKKLLAFCQQKKISLLQGDKGYATAPSNIALLKYWGKDPALPQIPDNSSLSFTLSHFRSWTQVEILNPESQVRSAQELHEFCLNGAKQPIPLKMSRWLQSLMDPFAGGLVLRITSRNNFPTACGIASSASGYAALAGAIANLLQLDTHFSTPDLQLWLTSWARLGSGSATRSALLGSNGGLFVGWEKVFSAEGPATQTLAVGHHPYWQDLGHCVFILETREKETPSTQGHTLTNSSPLHRVRVAQIPRQYEKLKQGLQGVDFSAVTSLCESDALLMHGVMQSGNPPLVYLDTQVSQALSLWIAARDEARAHAFWTLDAGPNIHVLFKPESWPFVLESRHILERQLKRKIPILKSGKQDHPYLFLGQENFLRTVYLEPEHF